MPLSLRTRRRYWNSNLKQNEIKLVEFFSWVSYFSHTKSSIQKIWTEEGAVKKMGKNVLMQPSELQIQKSNWTIVFS